ncbi:MAG: formylglycine-generating enzyme family protein [Acidobacteria bacterium]|nr:MAG: formylglycine-generating enzyme family protein [Acidobacteriota bacterium]
MITNPLILTALSLAAMFVGQPVLSAERQANNLPEAGQRITNSLGMSFVYIPAGQTVMGSAWQDQNRQYDEYPHPVMLSKAFWMSATEVTQGQWKAVMGATRSHFSGDELPVESVSWVEAVAFCEKLSRREGRVFRLPTEAEWEYACRAGSEGNQGADVNPEEASWFAANSDERTHPVATKKSNVWGLSDMLGNVAEWCSDTYQAEYPQEEAVDPAVRSERRNESRSGRFVGQLCPQLPLCRPCEHACRVPGKRDRLSNRHGGAARNRTGRF